jgi:hypothetical protein
LRMVPRERGLRLLSIAGDSVVMASTADKGCAARKE